MKLTNKGLSYVELVLAMGIGAVLLAFATFSISTISNNNASKGAKRLENAFATAKVTTMAKGQDAGRLYIEIKDSKAVYYIGKTNFENQKNANLICNTPCYLRFDFGGVDYYPVVYGTTGTEYYSYTFNQSTGALYAFATESLGGTTVYNPSTYNYSKDIQVLNHHGNGYTVKIYPDTGKTEMK